MDENEYKTAYNELVSLPCVFEKSILGCRVSCIKSSKKNLAERESICCSDEVSQATCKTWLSLLRKKAQFSLQLKNTGNTENVFPHAKEMKVQVGGVKGLVQLLDEHQRVAQVKDEHTLYDVFSTLSECTRKYGKLEQIPFDEIMKSVASFKLRS